MKKWFNKQTIAMFLAGILISALSTCVLEAKTVNNEFISLKDLDNISCVMVGNYELPVLSRIEGKTQIEKVYAASTEEEEVYFNVEELKASKILPR